MKNLSFAPLAVLVLSLSFIGPKTTFGFDDEATLLNKFRADAMKEKIDIEVKIKKEMNLEALKKEEVVVVVDSDLNNEPVHIETVKKIELPSIEPIELPQAEPEIVLAYNDEFEIDFKELPVLPPSKALHTPFDYSRYLEL